MNIKELSQGLPVKNQPLPAASSKQVQPPGFTQCGEGVNSLIRSKIGRKGFARKPFLLSFVFLIFCAWAHAQILHPVKWSYAAKKLSNTEAVVFLKATIDEGWHIYSAYQKDGGPVKTSFTFAPAKDYELTGNLTEPAPVTKYEEAFSMNVSYFQNSVIFQQKVKLNKSSTTVSGTLRFMVCNDHQCLPPENINFSIPVK